MSQLRNQNLLAACNAYYKVCDRYPLRPGHPIESMSSRALLAAVNGTLALKKLPGPGTVYALSDLPNGLSLNFIIQSRTTVETHLILDSIQGPEAATLAILSLETLKQNSQPSPNPPYPRPQVYSLAELIACMGALRAVAISVHGAVGGV